jgi:hypothetical protein
VNGIRLRLPASAIASLTVTRSRPACGRDCDRPGSAALLAYPRLFLAAAVTGFGATSGADFTLGGTAAEAVEADR